MWQAGDTVADAVNAFTQRAGDIGVDQAKQVAEALSSAINVNGGEESLETDKKVINDVAQTLNDIDDELEVFSHTRLLRVPCFR